MLIVVVRLDPRRHLGRVLDAHHGLSNAVFMPYVLAFNREAIKDRMDRAAGYLGLSGGAEGFLRWVLDVRERLGISHTADALGVTEDAIDDLAARAAVDPCAGGNPVPVDAAALAGLYRRALAGDV